METKNNVLMKFADFDTSMSPIILSKGNEMTPTVEDIDVYFEEMEQIIQTIPVPYIFISTGTRSSKNLSLEVKMHLAKRSQEIMDKYPGRSKASIIVADGLVATMALKMFSAFFKPLKDSIIVSTKEEAIAKAKQILAS